MANQLPLPYIPRELEGEVVTQRQRDGYINATAMCQAAGKLFADYARLGSTRPFLTELSAEMGIPITELVQSVRGGVPTEQGTWVHPQVAIHLAQWLSPRFAVRVTSWVYEWLSTNHFTRAGSLPYHLRRYVTNARNVPQGHFSVLTEITYPNEWLADFRRHFLEVWMPQRALEYFRDRDPVALEYLPRLLAAPAREDPGL